MQLSLRLYLSLGFKVFLSVHMLGQWRCANNYLSPCPEIFYPKVSKFGERRGKVISRDYLIHKKIQLRGYPLPI